MAEANDATANAAQLRRKQIRNDLCQALTRLRHEAFAAGMTWSEIALRMGRLSPAQEDICRDYMRARAEGDIHEGTKSPQEIRNIVNRITRRIRRYEDDPEENELPMDYLQAYAAALGKELSLALTDPPIQTPAISSPFQVHP